MTMDLKQEIQIQIQICDYKLRDRKWRKRADKCFMITYFCNLSGGQRYRPVRSANVLLWLPALYVTMLGVHITQPSLYYSRYDRQSTKARKDQWSELDQWSP
jgi:hypothetical protein